MKKKIVSALLYIIFFFNTNLLKAENSEVLKVGLLAPLTGEYKELGNSLLYSLQLALEEINDENILIIPRDTGFKDKKKLNTAIQEIISKGANVIIGPISNEDFIEVKKYSNVTFISPSNIRPEFSNNIISVGISLESQLISLKKFLIKNKKNKTVIMYPQNQYTNLIEEKLNKIGLNKLRKFKYNPNPETLTGEIEILTNYSQRKKFRVKKKNF